MLIEYCRSSAHTDLLFVLANVLLIVSFFSLGEGGIDGDGDITRSENITAFQNFVLDNTDHKGVHFLMADGVGQFLFLLARKNPDRTDTCIQQGIWHVSVATTWNSASLAIKIPGVSSFTLKEQKWSWFHDLVPQNPLLDQQSCGATNHMLCALQGFSVEGQENLQEILSKQLMLCQFLTALSVVRTGMFCPLIFLLLYGVGGSGECCCTVFISALKSALPWGQVAQNWMCMRKSWDGCHKAKRTGQKNKVIFIYFAFN